MSRSDVCELTIRIDAMSLQCWGGDSTEWIVLNATPGRRNSRVSIMIDRTYNVGPGLLLESDTEMWKEPEESNLQVFRRNMRFLFSRETEEELLRARLAQEWIVSMFLRGEAIHFAPEYLPALDRTIAVNELDRELIRRYSEVARQRRW